MWGFQFFSPQTMVFEKRKINDLKFKLNEVKVRIRKL